jgi:hypothetical protein
MSNNNITNLGFDNVEAKPVEKVATKKRMGRPPKNEAKNNKAVSFYVTEEQLEFLNKKLQHSDEKDRANLVKNHLLNTGFFE